MKVNFNTPLLDFNGNAVHDHSGDVLIKNAVINALSANDGGVDGNEKVKCFKLALRVSNDDNDYTVEELALIKSLVGRYMPPLVCGRVFEVIDGKGTENA